MLLDIEEPAFTDHEGDSWHLLQIIRFTVEGRHEWHPKPHIAMIAIAFLEEALPKHASWREYLLNASTASAWQAGGEKLCVAVTAKNIDALAHDLAQPAFLIVENGRNDGSFLRAVFAAYAPELHEAEKSNWLHIDHAGGTGEQGHIAADAASKFKHVVRVLVLKDNDARDERADETDTVSWPPAKPVQHVWRRHEVENYIPDAVLELCPHPRVVELIRCLRKMTPRQQGFIDMKRGIKKSPSHLFEDLDPMIQTIWQHGFGDFFLKPLVPPDLTLTVDDFRSLGEEVDDELRHLLAMIRRLV